MLGSMSNKEVLNTSNFNMLDEKQILQKEINEIIKIINQTPCGSKDFFKLTFVDQLKCLALKQYAIILRKNFNMMIGIEKIKTSDFNKYLNSIKFSGKIIDRISEYCFRKGIFRTFHNYFSFLNEAIFSNDKEV